jgi:hypothetical protein
MNNFIKNKFRYIFLYGIFFNKYIKSDIINNKTFLEYLIGKDTEENQKYLADMIDTNMYSNKIYLNPLDIITGGIPRFILWQSTKVLFNNTDFFINKDVLVKYGEFQRNNLINFLDSVENNKQQDFKENIILDVALDFLAFGERSSVFYQNMEILHKWIDEKILKATYDNSKVSVSFKLKLIGLKIQLLEYMPPVFVKNTLNVFFSKLTEYFTPFKVFEVIKSFNNNYLIEMYKENLEFQNYMTDLQKNMENDPVKKEEFENISKVMENGLLLPLKGVYKDINKIPLAENPTKEKTLFSKFQEGTINLFKPITDELKNWDILTKNMDFKPLDGNNDFKKLLIEKNPNSNDKIFLDNDDPIKQKEELKDIRYLRNNILYQNAMIEKLQTKNTFFPAFFMEYIVSKFQDIMEKKLTSMFEGFIGTLTLKTQNPFNNFVESIVISNEDNIKLEHFLKILIKNMTNNGPLPSILIGVHNFQIEALLKNYVYSLIKKHPISRYKILNPMTATKVSINKISKKNKKPKELQNLARKIFHDNIHNFNSFLKVHFLYEEKKYMSYFSTLQIDVLRMINKILEYIENPLQIGKTIFIVIEVSGLELLCAPRNESKKKNTNSMATSTFVNYVSGVLYKDKFLFAFTKDLREVDEAVKSRFTINTEIKNIGSLEIYTILIRRYLLNLMMKYKNILLLEDETFEKVLISLSYEFYIKSWTGSEIDRFFSGLEDKKRLKSYNNQYNKAQILKLMNEVLI